MERLLLLELVGTDKHRHLHVELFPFIQGLLREVGHDVRWRTIVVPPEDLHAGGRFVVGLNPRLSELVGTELAGFDPDVVLLNHAPSASLGALLESGPHGARVRDISSWHRHDVFVAELFDLLGPLASARSWGDRLLVDEAEPDFRRCSLDGVESAQVQAVTLVSLVHCTYRKSLVDNPHFAGLAEPSVTEHRGCSFCAAGSVAKEQRPHRSSAIDLAMRQILGYQRAVAEHVRCSYRLSDGVLLARLGELLDRVLDAGVRASTFFVLMRVDDLLHARRDLERLLPALAERGHELCFLSVGAENFSAVENERLNKGLTTPQIWACHEMLSTFERRFPGAFRCPDHGYFAAILFTPWTRIEDLRTNLVAARKLGWKWLQRVVGTRLQLFGDSPIQALASRDGLTTGDPGSTRDILPVCLSGPAEVEVPWRFADAKVDRVHSLVIRLDPVPEQARFGDDDPLLGELRALRAHLPRALGADYVEMVAAIVDAVDALGADTSVAELFDWIARRRSAGRAYSVSTPACRWSCSSVRVRR